MNSQEAAMAKLALFAPIAVVVAVMLAAALVAPFPWATALGVAVGIVASGAGALAVSGDRGSRGRFIAALIGIAVTVAVSWLLLLVMWPATITPDGLLPGWTVGAYVLVPIVALPIASIVVARRAKVPGIRLSLWWLAAIVALLAAWPIIGLASTGNPGQDMAGLIIYWVPVFALCVWVAPAVALLAARRFGAAPAPMATGGTAS